MEKKKVSTEKPVTMLNAMRILRKDIVFLVALVGIILSNCGFSHLTTTVSQYFCKCTYIPGWSESIFIYVSFKCDCCSRNSIPCYSNM